VADRGAQDLTSLNAVQTRLRRSTVGIVAAGLLASALVGLMGHVLISWRFGDSDAAVARAAGEVRQTFDRSAATLRRVAQAVAVRSSVVAGLQEPQETTVRLLFDHVAQVARAVDTPGFALTILDANGDALAWSGPSSDIPVDRATGGAALFVARGPLGLRLIHVEPVTLPVSLQAQGRPSQRRVGAIAAEQPLSGLSNAKTTEREGFPLETSIGRLTLRQSFNAPAGAETPFHFTLRAPGGETLLEAIVPAGAAESTRDWWRARLYKVVFLMLGTTLLLVTAACAFYRNAMRGPSLYGALTGLIVALIVGARVLLWWAAAPGEGSGVTAASPFAFSSLLLRGIHRSPLDLLITVLMIAGIVVTAIDPVRRYACSLRARRRDPTASVGAFAHCLVVQLAAGTVVLAIQLGVLAIVGDTVENTTVNLLRLTLQPWNSARLALLVALVLLQASAVWLAVLIFRFAMAEWRVDRLPWWKRLLVPLAWIVPSMVAIGAGAWRGIPLPRSPILLAVILATAVAYAARLGVPWYRHGTQATRMATLLVALVVPAWLLYPSLVHFVEGAKRRLVETQYAVDTLNHPAELLAHLNEALRQVDRVPGLPELLQSLSGSKPSTDAAFSLWTATDLEKARLTSAVELYGPDGSLVSRFALNLPDTEAAGKYKSRRCDWEIFGQAIPVGADERRMLHAERGICTADPVTGQRKSIGAVVLHVMLDYSALRFISSQSPYFQFIRGTQLETHLGSTGGDVELAVYGWGHLPIFTSGNRAWQLSDDIFARAYRSREPFWTVLPRGDARDHAHISNDRAGIYVVGYPVLTTFNHLVHLAEITTLAGLAFVALMTGAGLVRRLHRYGPYSAELLVREVRTSFYRKLFLAFVAAAVLPVLTLALLVRTYFANQLLGDVEAEAVRTAVVARRVIEESLALQQRQPVLPAPALTDDVMVWISRVINQDVNIYDGPRLLVTSERDLFASGLLPTRTPDAVYRAIALQRQPEVVDWAQIGDFPYLMAATPLQADGRETILTVPLASRQREILSEIDELDRGVHLVALVLILLGAGIGYWMAERIGDPVQRLTRATRRIAAGDLTARVIVKTADELQRLVEAFNKMAGELERQRQQLERTHRLEAWAEMARQVAHDIKNPLTPIQLSAEHLRRVNQDRGQPLSPVLDSCVDTILTQVRLLRQIASEFSSFGSSPTVTLAPTSMRTLVDELIDPYRLGTAGRITFDLDVPDALPPLAIDRVLMSRAITNIVENALYAMPSGGTLSIRAREVPWQPAAATPAGSTPDGAQDNRGLQYGRSGGASRHAVAVAAFTPSPAADDGRNGDRAVELRIADTGYGMDDEAARRIFEPYFSTKAAGTGLGLSIARRNVELHGGSIDVVSQKGVGTTVTIVVPVIATRELSAARG
jgi:signal transduction histidine kinase